MNDNKNWPFPGKIAVVTSAANTNEDDFYSAEHLIAKYGPEKIIHLTWISDFSETNKKEIDGSVVLEDDKEIKTLILNQAMPGSGIIADIFRKNRDDAFVVYCANQESPSEASEHANLILRPDDLGMGAEMVKQVKKQGAKVFVHYSFPRHMSLYLYRSRRDLIEQECIKEGIRFMDALTEDPIDKAGVDAARQYILKDVPRLVSDYGEDTAFFCTNCHLQAPLIKAVVDCHAIYPQPCCPSPYHGFPQALGIDSSEVYINLGYLIGEISRIAAEKNMTDRLSTWPVSASMMFTSAGAEYAIRRIKGEAPGDDIDNDILMDCMSTYISEVVGEESNVFMRSYTENGITYRNLKLILMSYLDF